MQNENYIGISEHRALHSLGVARKAYEITIKLTRNEDFAKKMFTLGYLHDIGYEFCSDTSTHPYVGAKMLKQIGVTNKNSINAIKYHGRKPPKSITITLEWCILNYADLQISPEGKDIGIEKRLLDIKTRYGEESRQYLSAVENVKIIEKKFSNCLIKCLK